MLSPEALEQVKSSLPGVELPMAEFAAWLDGRAPASLEEAYLVWACARGAELAIARLEREFLSQLRPVVSRIDHSISFQDEVLQRVRTRLLVVERGEPRILSWAFDAPLVSWLRAVAVRTALNLKREEGVVAAAGEDEDVLVSLATLGPSPEFALMRAQHQDAFRKAFHEVLATLAARERNVLRLQLVEGLTLDRIGALYRVNKSTVSR